MKAKTAMGLLLIAALIFTLLPTVAIADTGYTYIDENGSTQTTEALTVNPITSASTTFNSGWYVLDSDVIRNGTITVSGNANLILSDGCTLSITGNGSKAGIEVLNGNSISIYGQEAGTGTLNVQGGQNGAGIGGSSWKLGGTINIVGGTILAKGGQYGAGIGGGMNSNAGTTRIAGGTVLATGGEHSAGIGGAYDNVINQEYGSGGTISITGGNITANGNGYGAGIGGGSSGQSGNISISGGNIIATSGDVTVASGAAGIGGGAGRGANKIEISGGTVLATSLDYGAGIGGGSSGGGGIIEISGGDITALSQTHGAGIGGGWSGVGGTISITGGRINATAVYGGAGIGGGWNGSSGTINIHGGHITAHGGNWGAGIGAGGGASCNVITITTGIVYAYGDHNASPGAGGAGIGSGGANAGGTQRAGLIKILGGKVFAQSAFTPYSDFGLDIGRGRNGINGEIWIDDEAIVSLGNRGLDATVTTLGNCVIKGAGAGALKGIYEEGTRLDFEIIDLEATTLSNGTGFSLSGDTVTISGKDRGYALVGSTSSRRVVVASDIKVDVMLWAADIAPASGCAFDMSGATVDMRLTSANTLRSNAGFAGIQAPDGSSLTISGNGSLLAIGGRNAAGIGGGNALSGGDIYIVGGTVEASGNDGGSGVGGGNLGNGGDILLDGADTSLTAIGGTSAYDIGSGNSHINGGTLTIQNHASVHMMHNGTNALRNYVTGTVSGDGSQLDAGEYLDTYKRLTCTGITAAPASDAKAYDRVCLTAHVTGLSDYRPQGTIVFYDNNLKIGQASLNRMDDGSADAMAVLPLWSAQGGTHSLTAKYLQHPGWDSYYMLESERLTYEVARIEQEALSIIAVPGTVTYGDAPFALQTSGGSGTGSISYVVSEGDALAVDAITGVVTVLKAGSSRITVTKDGDINYNPTSVSVNIDVNKAIPTLVDFPSSTSITYGQALTDSLLIGGSGDGSFAWENPHTVPPVKNDGYAVIFTPNDLDNYDYTGIALHQTVEIIVDKATPIVTFPTAGEITYEESLAASLLTGGSGDGSFAWENPDTIPTVVNSGYNVKYTPHDTDNYITLSKNLALTVHKAEQSPLTIEEVSLTYGDAPFALQTSGGSGTGSFSYVISEGDALKIDATTGLVTVCKAGSASVKITKSEDSNYKAGEASLDFTVGKAIPTAVFPAATSITYGQSLLDSELIGGIGDGIFAWESPNTKPDVSSNRFDMLFTPDDIENYLTIKKSVALNVNKAEQSPLSVSGIPDDLSFGDAPFRLIVDGGSCDGTLRYTVTSGDAVAVDTAGEVTIMHAGPALIKVTHSGNTNYLAESYTVSLMVEKANQATALTFKLPQSISYSDGPFQISGSGGNGSGEITYFVSSGSAVEVSKTGMVTILRPGEAVITAEKVGDIDFMSQKVDLHINVKKGVQKALTISGIPSKVLTGQIPIELIVSGGSGSGILKYKVISGNAVSVDENGILDILNAGTALLSVSKAEDDYYLATTETVEIEVGIAVEREPSETPTQPTAPILEPSPKSTSTVAPVSTLGPVTTSPPSTQNGSSVSVQTNDSMFGPVLVWIAVGVLIIAGATAAIFILRRKKMQ